MKDTLVELGIRVYKASIDTKNQGSKLHLQ